MNNQAHGFLDRAHEEIGVAENAVRAILKAGAADADVMTAVLGALDVKIGRFARLLAAYRGTMIPFWQSQYAAMLRQAERRRATLLTTGDGELPHRLRVVLGDWSDDGHGKSTQIAVHTSHPVAAMRTAYEASVAATGLTFDHDHPGSQIVTEYEQSRLTAENIERLRRAGYDLSRLLGAGETLETADYRLTEDRLLDLLMWFVGVSLDGFRWAKAPEETEQKIYFNGFWGPLNVQFGYGLYD